MSSTTSQSPTETLLTIARSRRSHRQLGRNISIPDSEILNLVSQAILHVPSAFNSQTTRLIITFRDQHEKIWDLTSSILQSEIAEGKLSKEKFEKRTKPTIERFKNALGTILFYEDCKPLEDLNTKIYGVDYPIYTDKLDRWCDQTSAMHQYFLWMGLETLGLGANLQHYNPRIDASLVEIFGVSSDWRLTAQMVFGSIENEILPEKKQGPVGERIRVFGAD